MKSIEQEFFIVAKKPKLDNAFEDLIFLSIEDARIYHMLVIKYPGVEIYRCFGRVDKEPVR